MNIPRRTHTAVKPWPIFYPFPTFAVFLLIAKCTKPQWSPISGKVRVMSLLTNGGEDLKKKHSSGSLGLSQALNVRSELENKTGFYLPLCFFYSVSV